MESSCNFVFFYNYFTFWVITLQIIFYIGFIQKYQYSLLLLSILLPVIGSLLSHIYPRKLIYSKCNKKYIIDKKKYIITNIFLHIIPSLIFIFFYNNKIKIKKDNKIFMLLAILSYILMHNPFEKYNLNCKIEPDDENKLKCYGVVLFSLITLFIIMIFL